MAEAHRITPNLSILQMAKLVVFRAVIRACIAPAFHLGELGVARAIHLVILEAVAVPLVTAAAGFGLLRRGPRKDRFISLALLGSVVAALGFALWTLSLMVHSFAPGVAVRNRPGAPMLATTVLVILLLGAGLVFHASRLSKTFSSRAESGDTPDSGG